MLIEPASALSGEPVVPGDKSISHRYALLGAMAEGITQIGNYSPSQDCRSTINCLQQLGVSIRREPGQVVIDSKGWKRLTKPGKVLEAENSGTTIRLLSALLAASDFSSTIQGDQSLNQRPMSRITDPLKKMGAHIEAREGEFPPLRIEGTKLVGIEYPLPVASAQVKSCVLLAGLMASGKTVVVEETPTRDHTELALPLFGVDLSHTGKSICVKGPTDLRGADLTVPGDFSSAIFFIVAALLHPGSEIRIRRVGMNPTRTALLDRLIESGARIHKSNLMKLHNEPVCDMQVHYSPNIFKAFPTEVSGDLLANMIDEIPILAVLGVHLDQGLSVRGAAELRKKESDRIHAIVENLKSLGVETEEFPDGFYISPGQTLRGGRIRAFGDHRIAMAFAIAGLVSQEPIELDQPESVSVSFPDFFQALSGLGSRLTK